MELIMVQVDRILLCQQSEEGAGSAAVRETTGGRGLFTTVEAHLKASVGDASSVSINLADI